MTFHSKAATDEIYSIFNQPLKCETDSREDTGSIAGESEGDYEDDDYTSAGESTGTGRISGATSEFGDEETTNSTKLLRGEEDDVNDTQPQTTSGGGASEWTEFNASKDLPPLQKEQDGETEPLDSTTRSEPSLDAADRHDSDDEEEPDEVLTPVSPPESQEISHPTRYIPVPPEDHDAPTRPFRDSYQVAQNRLPFMTPIVEKTESSLALSTAAGHIQGKDYFTSKTPSRSNNAPVSPSALDGNNDSVLSSPFRDLVTPEKKKPRSNGETKASVPSPGKKLKLVIGRSPPAKPSKGPVINDLQVNPCDDVVRSAITNSLHPSLSSMAGFHDHSTENSNHSQEIRRYIKHLIEKKSRVTSERTQTTIVPPVIRLPGSSKVYAVRRELGKGAFAPVYLVEGLSSEDTESETCEEAQLVALKMEDPPTSWEFLMIRTLHSRLGTSSRTIQSLIQAHECHLYRDECFLFLDYADQGTLLDLVNSFRADNARNGKSSDAGLDEVLAMYFAVELFRVIEDCHRNGIIHGDLKADNCLVRLENTSLDSPYNAGGYDGWASKGITLIDFGRGIDVRKFKPEAQFIADWETGPQDCAEMRELRPWTYQIDYFGVAGVIHSLLFGKYIETVVDKSGISPFALSSDTDGGAIGGGLGAKKIWKLKEGFKRYWQGQIWSEVFSLLLNPTIVPLAGGMPGELEKMPLHKGMRTAREKMEAWLVEEGERKGLRTLIGRAERMVREAGAKKR